MSRKPTAISLSQSEEKPKRQAKTVPATERSQTKAKDAAHKPKSTSAKTTRKPTVMKAPDPAEAVDVFDPQSEDYVGEIPNHIPKTVKRSKLGVFFLTSITLLVSLGVGLWFTQVIEDLFARSEWLGWAASGLLAIAVLCLIVFLLREIVALWRLKRLGRIREDVMHALEGNTGKSSKVLNKLVGLYDDRKDMAWHISRLAAHKDDVMDDRDRLLLAEQYLMKPLDDEAKQIIASSAKRISVVTAVNPAASLDVIFTGYQILRMLRQLTTLYGNRPGSIGTFKMATMVGSHLAVTGGLALSDTVLQQFIGKGLAGRLSAKLGEGTVNGILTSRIGLAALDLCRPMPFTALQKPGLKEFISTLAGSFSTPKE